MKVKDESLFSDLKAMQKRQKKREEVPKAIKMCYTYQIFLRACFVRVLYERSILKLVSSIFFYQKKAFQEL